MARKSVQVQETMEGTDTDLSEACDAVLEARQAVKSANASLHESEEALISIMQSSGKKSVKHGGSRFQLVHQEEINKIQIKSE